jgi:hypothetical protein
LSSEVAAAKAFFERQIGTTRTDHDDGQGLDPADFSMDWESAVVSTDIDSLVSVDVEIDAHNSYIAFYKKASKKHVDVLQKLVVVRDRGRGDDGHSHSGYIMTVIPDLVYAAKHGGGLRAAARFVNGRRSGDFSGIVVYARPWSNDIVRVDSYTDGEKIYGESVFDGHPTSIYRMYALLSDVSIGRAEEVVSTLSIEMPPVIVEQCRVCHRGLNECICHFCSYCGSRYCYGECVECPYCHSPYCSGGCRDTDPNPGGGWTQPPLDDNEEEEEDEYTITVTALPSNGGTVKGGDNYKKGTNAGISATANSGYKFVKWLPSGSTSASFSHPVVGDASFTAVFEREETCTDCFEPIEECHCMTMSLTCDKNAMTLGDDYTLTLMASFKHNAWATERIVIYPQSLTRSMNEPIVDDYGNITNGDNILKTYNTTAKTPGFFVPVAEVHFEDGTVKYVTGPEVMVWFPLVTDVIANPMVSAMMDALWTYSKTLSGVDPEGTYEREVGVYIYLNVVSGQYELGEVITGDKIRQGVLEGVGVTYPPPGEVPGQRYAVAQFHTHPPTYYWASNRTRPVGLSGSHGDESAGEYRGDQAVAEYTGIPCIAYDYVGAEYDDGKNVYDAVAGGHPIDAAAKLYTTTNPTRREL